LDLDTAIATVSYTLAGTKFTREIFSKPGGPGDCGQPRCQSPRVKLTLNATMATPQQATVETAADKRTGYAWSERRRLWRQRSIEVSGPRRVLAQGGKTIAEKEQISVTNADGVMILIAVATSYRSYKEPVASLKS